MKHRSRWPVAVPLVLLGFGLILLAPRIRLHSSRDVSLGLLPVDRLQRSIETTAFNYSEALQKAIYFYDAQRSGRLPARGTEPGDNRVEWRGDSALLDGSDVGLDLTGGFYDAGDHVKFGFPMAGSLTVLAWGALAFQNGYLETDQFDHLLENLRWGTDWLLKAHPSSEVLYGQVGNGTADHSWWGPAEVMPMSRPAYKITSSCPGSDLAGEAAAALAAAALVFKPEDASYSSTLLSHAKQLYAFADSRRGKYSDCITDAASYYNSWSGYTDELVWGALWLYYATGDKSYLDKAKASFSSISGAYKWTLSWDDKSYGSFVLLARLTGDSGAKQSAERFLDYWTSGYNGARVPYTPGGLAFLSEWGSLRYAANTAFLAFIYSDYLESVGGDSSKVSRYRDFAARQIRYMLGENPSGRSYVVGFGNNPPKKPHHRTSHGSWLDSMTDPASQRHVLYGALVGGPDQYDTYEDDRTDYVANEVALDYNAAFVGALARLARQYPGTILTSFPVPETRDDDEIYVTAALKSSGSNYSEIRAIAVNKSAWPARTLSRLKLRYYFTLESGLTPGAITVSSSYTECRPPTGPYPFQGTLYYVEADCSGSPIYPGGTSLYKREIQLRVSSTGAWDASNDWSAEGLTTSGMVKTPYIALYEDSLLVWGNLPDGSTSPEEGCVDELPPADPEPPPSTDTSGDDEESEDEPVDPPVAACTVQYTLQSDWGTGFVADVRFVNQSAAPLSAWLLTWRFSGNQKITNLWNGKVTQSGANVSVEDADWNAVVQPGASVSFGFQAEYSGPNSLPTTFVLNGVSCSTGQTVAGGGHRSAVSTRARSSVRRVSSEEPALRPKSVRARSSRGALRSAVDGSSDPCGGTSPTATPQPEPTPVPDPEDEAPGCSARLPALLSPSSLGKNP